MLRFHLSYGAVLDKGPGTTHAPGDRIAVGHRSRPPRML